MNTAARLSTYGSYVVYKSLPAKIARNGSLAVYAVHAPPAAKNVRDSTLAAYVVCEMNPNNVPRNSTFAAYVVWATGTGDEARTRAWTYTLDGHTFYVLDLGQEGTFAYDFSTGQWTRFRTAGFAGWNLRAGTMWGDKNRIVGGDTLYNHVWELDPDTFKDEGFRDIEHVVTGGVATRSRVHHSVESLRVSGSLGQFTSENNAVLRLRYSDDNGQTWTEAEALPVEQDVPLEVTWRSLGSFMAPGRIFEITDIGGMFRIDGADVFIHNFDDDGPANG
jgi:hypothetical protein